MQNVNKGLGKVTNELSQFKAEINAKVETLEKKYEEMLEEGEERLEEFKAEVRNEISKEIESRLQTWKDALKNEIVAELRSEVGDTNVSVNPPDLPQSSVGLKFQHLLRLSRSLESNFCMGHAKMKKPVVRAHIVLRQFFPEFEITVAGKKDDVLVRFSVLPKAAAGFRAKLQKVRGAILTYGWWVAQENPADLRAMYTLTNDFLKFAKNHKTELKGYFLTIERGWVFYRDLPLLPVFLIPANSDEWDVLTGMLLVKLKACRQVDWLARVAEAPKPDNVFLGKWLESMKLKPELANALVPLFSSQEASDVVMNEAEFDASNTG
jgi:gas vesicle protein